MNLLAEKALLLSPVVANINMNRSRNATGINSYEKDLKLNPLKFLTRSIEDSGEVSWSDLCCGEGRALIQAALFLRENNLHHKAQLTGIDLVNYFAPVPAVANCLTFLVTPVDAWKPANKYDLITCVHGLHYTGNKLSILEKAMKNLKHNGVFKANFDITGIHIKSIDTGKYLKNIFLLNNIQYNSKARIITCTGARNIDFGVNYLGANDKAGPNYTGQEAVEAYYALY